MARIISIANMKGGCGKTTVSVNLAAAMAVNQKYNTQRICVIDCDPQSNATTALLQEGDEVGLSIYNILNNENPPLDDCFYPTVHERLKLLPNILSSTSLEISLAKAFPESNTILRDTLWDYLHEHFDIVLIDNNPTLGVMLNQSLCVSTEVFVIIEAGSSNSLLGIPELIRHISAIQETQNPEIESIKVIINKLNRTRKADKENLEDIYQEFGKDSVYDTVIPMSADFRSVEKKTATTIMTYKNGRSRAAQAMRSLAVSIFKESEG